MDTLGGTITGTVIRVVNESDHTPPVLVAWRANSTWVTEWRFHRDITLSMQSAAKDRGIVSIG